MAKILPDEQGAGFINPNMPNARSVPTDTKAATVIGLWDVWTKERETKESVWLQCERAYLSAHDEAKGPLKWNSKAYVPAANAAVENIHSQLMKGLFPHAEAFDIKPTGPDAEFRAQAVRALLEYQMRRSSFRAEYSKFLKQMIIIGSSAATVDWHREFSGETLVFEGPRFTALDMKYFHVDPFSSDANPNILRKYWISTGEARRSKLFNDAAITSLNQIPAGTSATTQDAEAIAKKQAFGLTGDIHSDRGEIEVTEFWGTVEIEGEYFENYVISIANGSTVLRCDPSPYSSGKHPFVYDVYNPVAGEAYGIGALEPALDLQYLINTFTNQKVDELSIIINGIYKYIDDGVIDSEQQTIHPGAWIEVGDMTNLEPIHPSQSVALAYNEIQDLERKFEEATGALKLVSGGMPKGTRTATETMAIQQSGNSRFDEILAHIETHSVQQAMYLYMAHSAQFLTDELAVKIVGQDRAEWLTVSPEDLAMNFEIIPGGARMAGIREMRMRNLLQYLQTVGGIEAISQRLDWDKVDKRIWREMGFNDEESLLLPAPAQPALGEEAAGAAGQPAGAPDLAALASQIMGGAGNVQA